MGFCRSCGSIVSGPRCKCGGTPVAALYAAKRSEMQESSQDRWSKTYISSSKGGQSSKSEAQTSTSTSTTEFRRFPKPRPFSSVILRHDVTDHINSTTRAQTQPALPKQHSFHVDSDVLPSMGPHEPMLSKVYGSVLQPADSLPLHSCAICLAIFPPDATIYPNPSQQSPDTPSYVCRTCFSTNGGSKGICPTCSKPVLALKAEGAFIHSGGKYWHKRCFNCFSCLRNIGESPLVDLAGRPSCEGCFDNSYKEPTTPKKQWPVASDESPTNQSDTPADSKRTIEELEQRLNIRKSQAGSPSRPTPTKIPVSPPLAADRFSSPQSKRLSSPPRLAPVSIEFKRSVSRETAAEPVQKTPFGYPTMEPDVFGPIPIEEDDVILTKNTTSSASSTLCSRCNKSVIGPRDKGQYITVPSIDEDDNSQTFHTECFRCAICDQSLVEAKKGQLGFVRSERGPCHPQCAPKEGVVSQKTITTNVITKSIPATSSVKVSPAVSTSKPSYSLLASSSRYETPLASPQQSSSKSGFPRFGGASTCPGCHKAVSPMERGVVPGPQGSRWHASCLVCGGKKDWTSLGRDVKGAPGCGKKLDSAAKTDGEGHVWCRECLLLRGIGGSPHTSPTRPVTLPTQTGLGNERGAQPSSGLTTLSKQFTGSTDSAHRQYVAGKMIPTRSISPTKQLGSAGAMLTNGARPRPKSVIGMRSSKSIDEGRGMYLVRQMTGDTSRFNFA